MEHKRTMTSSSHYRHYESWPGCAGEAVVKVQRGKGTRMSNSPRGGSNREVVRKEISVRIIIACGHDIQVTNFHVQLRDEWLWESTMQAFNRQFADVLEQEKAKALLRKGFKMEGGDLDAS